VPLSFEVNEGRTDSRVKYFARGRGYTLSFSPTEATLAFKSHNAAAVLSMKLEGGNSQPELAAVDELPGKVNYFIGNDPQKWRTKVSTYAKVKYAGVYPGIDLIYYGNQKQLEYDFSLAPGANPRLIRMKFDGSRHPNIDRNGSLVVGVGEEQFTMEKPVAYQQIDGQRREVSAEYVLLNEDQLGFRLGHYDPRQPLVIDPILQYSTFLGGLGGPGTYGIGLLSTQPEAHM
jgi:hypothetical protein